MSDNSPTLQDIRKIVRNDSSLSSFQKKVYLATLDIPCGTTISYGELARRIGCRSAQAVGQALKRNPYAPIVPCHRVVAKDGTMHGYQGKTDADTLLKKAQLLKEEATLR